MAEEEKLERIRKTMEKRFYDCVFNDTLTGLVFKFQRDLTISRSMNLRHDNDEKHTLPPEPAEIYDIFGHEKTSKKMVECECYVCHRMIAAARFAPHMEKCIGNGRAARQTRSRTAANYADALLRGVDTRTRSASVQSMAEEEDAALAADDNDEEWSNSCDTKTRRARAAKTQRPRSKKTT